MVETLAKQLAQPPAQRDFATAASARTLKKHGYEEAPEITKLVAERSDRIKTWLRENRVAVQSMEARIAGQTPCKQYPSAQEYQADLIAYLQEPKAYSGTNWQWFGRWLDGARAGGFKDADEMTAGQVESAADYARQWLDQHDDVVASLLGIMSTSEGPDAEEAAGAVRSHASSMVSFWIVLFGVGAAWAGRNAFNRPWELMRFPERVLEGMRRLIRKDRYAVARIVGGLVAMGLVGVVIVLLMAAHFHNRPVAKFVAGLLIAAAAVVCSGLSFGEDESAQSDSTISPH
jgi:hypothetical protein